MNTFDFATPVSYLTLETVGAIAAVILLLRIFRPQLGKNLPWYRLLFYGAITLLLLLAASTPVRQTPREKGRIVALVDLSDSNDSAVQDKLLQRARSLATENIELLVLPFGGVTAPLPLPLSAADSFATLRNEWSKLNIGKTDIEQALRSGAATGAKVLVLLSDGQETVGSVRQSLPALTSSQSSVFPLVFENSRSGVGTIKVTNLVAPLLANAQESVSIRTSVENFSPESSAGTLVITHGKKELLRKEISLAGGEKVVLKSESDPKQEGEQPIVATFTPRDEKLPPSSLRRFLSTAAREKVLLLSGSAQDERLLLEALQGQGFSAEHALASRQDPYTFRNPEQFSTIILNNAEYQAIGSSGATALSQYVRKGGSLIMVGGERSFGLGGYLNTEVADLLPVELLPPQTEKKRLNVAVELVLDKSKSMDAANKIEFAREASREVIRNLKPDDYVGVIGFDSTPFVVVQLAEVGTNREMAMGRVDRLIASGRTNLMPALDEARRSLARVRAGRKHIIVLTDGKIPGSGSYFLDMVRDMRLYGVTVSTVLVGGEVDDGLLREIADQGGGSFYATADAASLPRIFMQDVKVAGGEQTLKESQEYQVRRGSGDLKSTTLEAFPLLKGYVQTKPRPNADLELVATAEAKAEPLLASWKVGQGHVIAYTSDANGRWSEDWVRWPRFQKFWTELVSHNRAEEEGGNATPLIFDLTPSVVADTLSLDLVVYNGDGSSTVRANVVGPDGKSREIDFQPIAPGHYRAELPKVGAGDYHLKAQQGSRPLTPVAFSLSGELFGEKKGLPPDLALLSEIASATGGKLNPQVEDLARFTEREVESEDLTKFAFGAAFATFAIYLLLTFLLGGGLRRRFTAGTKLLSKKPNPSKQAPSIAAKKSGSAVPQPLR